MPARSSIRLQTTFIVLTVVIDAMGIGLILPVTPDLIRELTGDDLSNAALWGGWLAFIYAIMQFLCSPTIGNLSDRFGRRPILLVSLAALGLDYIIMGLAPTLALLFLGRAVAGIAGATHATAHAYMADISRPEDRSQAFGLVGAGFGIGFILGPLIGGLLGEFGTRAPFFAAAALALANFLFGLFVLPETVTPDRRRPFRWSRANPLGTLRQLQNFPTVTWFIIGSFFFSLAHFVYPAIWSFYTKEVFNWTSAEVGLSLTLVGIGFALVQGGLMRPILAWLGHGRTVLVGLALNVVALLLIAFTTVGWLIYLFIPVTALGAIVSPALNGLMSNRVPTDSQGELQGALASVTGITAILSPVLMTQLFGYFSSPTAFVYFPGAPFVAAAVLVVIAMLPLAVGLRHGRDSAAPE